MTVGMTVTVRARVRQRRVPYAETIRPFRAPECPYEALMMAGPEEPAMSRLELLAIRDVLNDAFDLLDPRAQWVLNAVVVERKSMRTIARELSLSLGMVHKISVQAKSALRLYLIDYEPWVKEYL